MHACLQGVMDTSGGRRKYVITDPAVLCEDEINLFGGTNLGQKGMDAWFSNHYCNKYCCMLHLQKHHKQPSVSSQE